MVRLGLIQSKLLWLAFTMFIAVSTASGIGVFILYKTSLSETAEHLTETAKSNALLIESIARHSLNEHFLDADAGYKSSLQQVKKAYENIHFGDTGEFTLAKCEGNQVVFLLRNHLHGMDVPDPVQFEEMQKATPMRKALAGESGSMIGFDYRGATVMAAYEPVKTLNLGIVAKIDMQEIYAPYIQAIILIIAIIALISLLAVLIFYRLGLQISEKFKDSTRQFSRLATHSQDVIYRITIPGGHVEYVNPAIIDLLEITPEQLYKSPNLLRDLMHPDFQSFFDEQWRNAKDGKVLPNVEFQVVTRSGISKWLNQRNVLVSDAQGKPIALEGIATDITEHKKHVQVVNQEKEVAQRYLDIVGSIIVVLDEKGRITIFNQRACQVLGCDEQEALGTNWFDHFLPQDVRDGVTLVFDQLMSGETEPVEFFENSVIAENGEEHLIAWHNTTLKADDGRVIGILSSGEDITDRKKKEIEIRTSNDLRQTIIETAPIRVFWKDRESHFLGCNTEFALDAGLQHPDDLIGKSDFDMIWKEEAEAYQADDRKVMESKIPKLEYEEAQTTPDGKKIWLRTSKVPLKDTAGEVIGILGIYEDITEHKQREIALIESNAKFKSVFESKMIANIFWNVNGEITDANGAFLDLFEYTRDEVISGAVSWKEMTPQEYTERDDIAMQELIDTGIISPFEKEFIRKDGARIPILIGGALISGSASNGTAYIIDISDLKKAEALIEDTGRMAQVGGWELNTETMTMICSEEVHRIHETALDYTPSLDGMIDFYTPEGRPVIRQAIQRAMDAGESFDLELPFISAKGKPRWGHVIGKAHLKNGKPFKVSGAFQDITERKDAENALKDEESHARGIIESAQDAFVGIDSQGMVIDWNPEAERMFGFSFDDVIGRNLADTIIPHEFRKRHVDGLIYYLATGNGKLLNKHLEITALHKNGNLLPVELSIVPLKRGDEVTFGSFIRNLTERNRSRDALVKSEETIREGLIGTILAISKAVEARDPYTAGHQQRVSRLSRAIAQEMGLDKDMIEGVRMGAIIHDIGKIQLPAEIFESLPYC